MDLRQVGYVLAVVDEGARGPAVAVAIGACARTRARCGALPAGRPPGTAHRRGNCVRRRRAHRGARRRDAAGRRRSGAGCHCRHARHRCATHPRGRSPRSNHRPLPPCVPGSQREGRAARGRRHRDRARAAGRVRGRAGRASGGAGSREPRARSPGARGRAPHRSSVASSGEPTSGRCPPPHQRRASRRHCRNVR